VSLLVCGKGVKNEEHMNAIVYDTMIVRVCEGMLALGDRVYE